MYGCALLTCVYIALVDGYANKKAIASNVPIHIKSFFFHHNSPFVFCIILCLLIVLCILDSAYTICSISEFQSSLQIFYHIMGTHAQKK